jgi:hypothetical protein
MKARFIVLRVIGALLLVALMAGGAFAAYRFGYAQGVAQSPAVAEALAQGLKNGAAVPFQRGFGGPMMYGYGYPMGMWGHHGFFPFGGILGFLFMAFLFFGLLRLVFFRPHFGWHGHWHGREWGGPPWMHGDPQQPGQPGSEAPAQPETPKSENK